MSIAEQIAKRHQADAYGGSENSESKNKMFNDEKEEATSRGEPWVKILDTKINPENVKYGFFEMDWNEPFIEILLDHGFSGSSQEEIVDKWFNSVIREMLNESGIESDINSGNVVEFLKNDQD